MPSLTITSQSDAQVLLIGGDLKLERRGVGILSADLPRGFYKVKAERGGGTVEQLIELDSDRQVYLYVDSFPSIAPLQPLLGQCTPVIEALGVQIVAAPPPPWSEALRPHFGAPGAPGLLVLGHRARADESDPLAGLRLMPWNGPEAVNLVAMGSADTVDEQWAGVSLPLRPAYYLLEIADAEQKVVQAVPVSPGWQTRVFLRRRKWLPESTQSGASRRRDWIDVSIQMARPHAPVVYSDHLETVEVARNALELTRTNFVAGSLIEALLTEKFDNPVAGIAGLHLFLEALERGRSTKPSDREVQIDDTTRSHAPQIIREGLGNLERLLGAGASGAPGIPSDLIALKLRAGLPFAGKTVVQEPPMFWVSWDVLRRNSDVDQPVEVSPDLWRRIAFANAWGPYLAWPPRETSVDDFLDSHLRASGGSGAVAAPRIVGNSMIGLVLGHVLASTGLEQRKSDTLRPLLEGAELAKALGIPLSVAARSRKQRT